MKNPIVVLASTLLLAALVTGGCRKGENSVAETAPQRTAGGSSAAAEPSSTRPELGYNAREGRALFLHYCATCHGPEGHGDGFNSYNLDPKPRDLSDPAFQQARSDEDLRAVIRMGGGAAGLSTAMPPWGKTLKDRQIYDLTVYLRTLTAAAAESAGGPSTTAPS